MQAPLDQAVDTAVAEHRRFQLKHQQQNDPGRGINRGGKGLDQLARLIRRQR